MRPVWPALIAGLVAALFAFALFGERQVPAFAVAMVGGASGGVARFGGVVANWAPRDGQAAPAFDPDDTAVAIHTDAGGTTIELAGIAEADAPELIAGLDGDGLELREVVAGDAVKALADQYLAPRGDAKLEVDQWTGERDGASHVDYFLRAHTRGALEAAFAEAERQGWQRPPHTVIGYEQRDREGDWRSYVLSDTVALGGAAIADATGSYDPNTNQPIVLLEFTRAGGHAFGDLTARIVGGKLAIVLGDRVRSAPVINDPIRGGRASIAMGGTDPVQQERERDVMIHVLLAGRRLVGGTFSNPRWVAPAPSRELHGRLALSLLVGAAGFALAFALIAVVRPERRRRAELPVPDQKSPLVKRVVFTLIPLAVYALGVNVTLPGVNATELGYVMAGPHRAPDLTVASVFALGIMPLVTAFIAVELAASIVPRWRRLRDGALGRVKLGRATAIVALACAAVQAYFVTTYFASIGGGLDLYRHEYFWLTAATLVGGTAVLAVLASVIGSRGIGNGYAVLLVFAWLWRPDWLELALDTSATDALMAGAEIAAAAVIALGVLGWRVGAPGRVALPLPIAGKLPAHEGGGAVAAIATLAGLGVQLPLWVDAWRLKLQLDVLIGAIALTVATFVWGFAFARPGRRRAELAAAGVEPASWGAWLRAALISIAAIGALFALALLGRPSEPWRAFAQPLAVVFAAATIADVAEEWRARRRGATTAVWPLHDPLLVDVARDRLAAAGIPHAIQATRARTLLYVFGSYVPMMVLVPDAHAAAARALLSEWLEPGTAS